jgi:rubrerythrin
MKPYDPKTAISVWDRVKSAESSGGDAPAILNLIEEELADAATYLRLAKKLPPPQAAIARQLSQQEQSHAVCLKGIYSLITGRKALVPQPVISDDPPEIVLRRCYGREMRCLAQYEARRSDPLYGHVFRKLAQEEQVHCHRLLELLGAITK